MESSGLAVDIMSSVAHRAVMSASQCSIDGRIMKDEKVEYGEEEGV